MSDPKHAIAPQFSPYQQMTPGGTKRLKTTPSPKESKRLVQAVQERLKKVTARAEEEAEAMKRGDTHIEDFAWEDELEPHPRKRR